MNEGEINCFKFSKILITYGAEIVRDHIEYLILNQFQFDSIKSFFHDKDKFNKSMIEKILDNEYFRNNLHQVIVKVDNEREITSLKDFDINSCCAIAEYILHYKHNYIYSINLRDTNVKYDFYKDNLKIIRELRNDYFGHLVAFRMDNLENIRLTKSNKSLSIKNIQEILLDLCHDEAKKSEYKAKTNQVLMKSRVRSIEIETYKKVTIKEIITNDQTEFKNIMMNFERKNKSHFKELAIKRLLRKLEINCDDSEIDKLIDVIRTNKDINDAFCIEISTKFASSSVFRMMMENKRLSATIIVLILGLFVAICFSHFKNIENHANVTEKFDNLRNEVSFSFDEIKGTLALVVRNQRDGSIESRFNQSYNKLSNYTIFIKRENLVKKVNKAFKTKRIVILYGPSGIGKSTILNKYLEEKKLVEKKNVYFVEAADDSIDNEFELIAEDLYDAKISKNKSIKGIFKKLNHSVNELQKNILFGLDNVESYEKVKSYLPISRDYTKILITTRSKTLCSQMDNEAECIRMSYFDESDTNEYIRESGVSLDLEEKIEIINMLTKDNNGILPLELSVVINAILNNYLAKSKLKTIFQEIRQKKSSSDKYYSEFVKFIFDTLKERSNDSFKIMQYAAFLDVSFIDLYFLNSLLYGSDEDKIYNLIEAINELNKLSFVKIKNQNSGIGIQIHSITQKQILIYLDKKKHVYSDSIESIGNYLSSNLFSNQVFENLDIKISVKTDLLNHGFHILMHYKSYLKNKLHLCKLSVIVSNYKITNKKFDGVLEILEDAANVLEANEKVLLKLTNLNDLNLLKFNCFNSLAGLYADQYNNLIKSREYLIKCIKYENDPVQKKYLEIKAALTYNGTYGLEAMGKLQDMFNDSIAWSVKERLIFHTASFVWNTHFILNQIGYTFCTSCETGLNIEGLQLGIMNITSYDKMDDLLKDIIIMNGKRYITKQASEISFTYRLLGFYYLHNYSISNNQSKLEKGLKYIRNSAELNYLSGSELHIRFNKEPLNFALNIKLNSSQIKNAMKYVDIEIERELNHREDEPNNDILFDFYFLKHFLYLLSDNTKGAKEMFSKIEKLADEMDISSYMDNFNYDQQFVNLKLRFGLLESFLNAGL